MAYAADHVMASSKIEKKKKKCKANWKANIVDPLGLVYILTDNAYELLSLILYIAFKVLPYV